MSASVGYRRRDANASDAIAAIMHPDEGFREKQQRRGVRPKDFERENKLRVKKLQQENRERRRREEAQQQQDFKLTRFKSTKKESVDFVNANAWEVIKKAPPVHIEEQAPRPVNPNYGRIPRYLLERKEQWAQEEEERRKNAPDPDCPPGMVLLDEGERVRTLNVLRKSLTEAQLRMNSLPLRIETFNQIRRKNELETKLQEIEDAIKVFDRAKVYVAAPLSSDPEKNRERTASTAA
ncbi:GPI inositol-deacylase [Phytophthora nicotianae]|uniref:GPI inositol-deacylase n=1 Tax=Phytophthora nicotianae TaxID=4792 RepID=A0A0W8DLU4_PHYNI|nr:GPI inositol-deacylase [Phytophthora nicotianae]